MLRFASENLPGSRRKLDPAPLILPLPIIPGRPKVPAFGPVKIPPLKEKSTVETMPESAALPRARTFTFNNVPAASGAPGETTYNTIAAFADEANITNPANKPKTPPMNFMTQSL